MITYRGNLVSDFNPSSTGNLIESVTPKLQSDPFLRLLVRSYAEATSDEDSNIAMLRAWTVLELLADREIQKNQPIFHLDGKPILNARNNTKNTNAKEARVYELIRRSGAGFPSHMISTVDGKEMRLLLGGNQKHPGYTPSRYTQVTPPIRVHGRSACLEQRWRCPAYPARVFWPLVPHRPFCPESPPVWQSVG